MLLTPTLNLILSKTPSINCNDLYLKKGCIDHVSSTQKNLTYSVA